jgi:nicotinamidase-related amidase
VAGELSFDRTRTSVLSLDLQQGIVSVYVKDEAFLQRVAAVVRHARRLQLPVIHVKVGFRPGVPEASPRNVFLSAVKASVPHQKFFHGESAAIHPGVAADDRDLVVTKNRISAFAGTDLDLLLRAHDVDTVMMFGIATSGVVLATALQAADLDYRVIVLKDCCADLDEDTHVCVVEKLLPRLTTVTSSGSFLDVS